MRDRVAPWALLVLAAWVAGRLLVSGIVLANVAWAVTHDGGGHPQPLDFLFRPVMALEAWLGIAAFAAFVALGWAWWREPAARVRFLVAFGLLDALLVLALVDATGPDWRWTEWGSRLYHGAVFALLAAMGPALCWGAPRARGLALGGVAVLAAHTLAAWTLNGAFGTPPLPNVEAVLASAYVLTRGLDAAGLALLAAALVLAAGPHRLRRDPPPDPQPGRTL